MTYSKSGNGRCLLSGEVIGTSNELTRGPDNSEPLQVLDLFAGLGGWSQAFRDRGHAVTRVELEDWLEAEIHANVLDLTVADLPGPWDIVLASPPCEKFSLMSCGHHWHEVDNGYLPKHPEAVEATRLALHTQYLLANLDTKAAVMENPRGLMRKVLPAKPVRTVAYCQYGDTKMKPTDLWLFGAARSFYWKPMCRNGAGCHEASPRGTRSGTQTPMRYWERSLIPYGLSEAVCVQMEEFVAGTLIPGSLAI